MRWVARVASPKAKYEIMHPLEEEDLPGRSHWKFKNLDPKKCVLHYIIYVSLLNIVIKNMSV